MTKEHSVFKCKYCGDVTEGPRDFFWYLKEKKCSKCNNDKFWYKVIEVLA